ncbi:MAG: polymer-forming cytoskeletal protein [Gemmatimonadota bacterium]|nr:polymer-forming cytoskeletal protein [Gemmatimonadota bacterium]
MAIWKEAATQRKEDTAAPTEPVTRREPEQRLDLAPPPAPAAYAPPRRSAELDSKESLLTAGLTIEGKIEGAGHIRIAGKFHGDVNVRGNLAIEPGAKLVGGVTAETVTVGGELDGNITNAAKVELLESGVLTGDLKAGSLTVAAGSRMRGRVEFGWDDEAAPTSGRKSNLKMESGSAS